MVMMVVLTPLAFPSFSTLVEHNGIFSSATPPTTDTAFVFWNTHPFGASFLKLLDDRFKYIEKGSFSSSYWIFPDKLFWETYKHFKEA